MSSEQIADTAREIRMTFTAQEVVLVRRAMNVALDHPANFLTSELALLDEIETGFGMVVREGGRA